MKVALVNPPWSFEGSIYFGCREPHLPLEYGYAQALLEREGHEAKIIDAQLFRLSLDDTRRAVEAFAPDMTVVTTAPSYLFWRCAPPELRVPQTMLRALGGAGGLKVVIGPHASTTPRAALRKLSADVAVMGECEEVLCRLARAPRGSWRDVQSIAYRDGESIVVQGVPAAVDMAKLPALTWDYAFISAHEHHHHRFDTAPLGPGAEVEATRGCPYHCTFCAKDNYRDDFRRRPLSVVFEEIDFLITQGVRYLYFIDEIFVPNRPLLEGLAARDVVFGVQMRIDNWSPETLDMLGRAGCVSIEAGVESITPEGRSLLAKHCKMSTEDLTRLLIHAKRRVPFVQANLLDSRSDDPAHVAAWRSHLKDHGVWANEPVPLFPYPGSPGYTQRWGAPDDQAWERAHAQYLSQFESFSDIQEKRPLPLSELEREAESPF